MPFPGNSKRPIVLLDFLCHQLSALFQKNRIAADIHALETSGDAALPEILSQFVFINDPTVDRLLCLALSVNLLHIFTGSLVGNFYIDLLLQEDIVSNLIVLRLRNSFLGKIVLREQVVDIPPIFQHGFHVDLGGKKSETY